MSTPEKRLKGGVGVGVGSVRPEENKEEDLSTYVEGLLGQMQSSFQQMSEAIITRIDDMGNRIDGLEKSVSDLMNQAGIEEENQNPENQIEGKR